MLGQAPRKGQSGLADSLPSRGCAQPPGAALMLPEWRAGVGVNGCERGRAAEFTTVVVA